MKKSIGLLLMIAVLITACKEMNSYQIKIKNSKELKLYKIASTPVVKGQQVEEEKYIADYKIVEEIELSEKQKRQFQKVLLKKDIYMTENTKRCPFLPQYAVEVDSTLNVLISQDPCGKVQFAQSDSIVTVDLVEKNELEEFLKSL